MSTTSPAAPALDLAEVYRDLHRNPELSYQETRTSGIVAQSLTDRGYDVATGIGRTGVVGVLRNGEGPTVLLRADMDALPVEERTGLDYASAARGVDPEGADVSVMHACGHDMHVTCLLGAAERLVAERDGWAGTLMLVFQPAEELGTGADAMIADGLFERFGRPDVVLGQHVAPIPAGLLGLHPGPAFAAFDALKVTLHGRGGHGSRPEACVDPVVMAASVVMRLQGIVSREIAGGDTAVVTVGTMRAGTKVNIIPDTAELQLSIRSFDPHVRARVLTAVERIVNGEAQTSGAERMPDIEAMESFPPLLNDPAACARTAAGFDEALGAGRVVDPGQVTGSEDVGGFATAAGVPCVYWLLGGADPAAFSGATDLESVTRLIASLPSNHSPLYAPIVEPTISTGVAALVAAARTWLATAG